MPIFVGEGSIKFLAMTDDTPLFTQYQSIKAQYPDDVLFFRLGDFYEMFDSDAEEVSRLLNLTLTHRGDRKMCGVPYHSSKVYIARLLRLGRKIAIAEQIGEIAKGKGLTERKVVEVITPGTAVESEYLDGGASSFLASVFVSHGKCGFAFIDVTTGEFKATSFPAGDIDELLPKEVGRCGPKEMLLPQSLKERPVISDLISSNPNMTVSWYPDWNFNAELGYSKLVKQVKTANLNSFSLSEDSPEVPPAGFLLDYLEKTTNAPSPHVKSISVYYDADYLMIDESSRKNLEILCNLRDGGAQFSLLESVNHTRTAMGSRLIREWLMFPLTDREKIIARQNHVQIFVDDRSLLRKVRDMLDGILDIERLSARIAMERAHAKDLQALKSSLVLWLKTRDVLSGMDFAVLPPENAQSIIEMIEDAILEDPSTSLTEGGIIKPGWSEELDHWRDVQKNFNSILDAYLEEEKAATGIQGLKIKNTGNMGYFIEVSRGKVGMVPEHFILRKALVNADRFTTARLQELEQSLNESGTKILELERDLFLELRGKLKEYVNYLMETSQEVAYTDVSSSLAQAAVIHNWVRPEISNGTEFEVSDGRHPVVEMHLPTGEFVPNSLSLNAGGNGGFFALITGPNMAGKSTFLRQNALISLLAQTGSFVPAESAQLGIVDRIFCRVGASDNLARGESTFLVEMSETAHILRSATERSLVIMDEVGRGTSTEDGLSIAWAVSEYLLERIKCKTLFATHYHELTRMEHPMLKKLCMAVSEDGESVHFLRKVIEGSAENSYGIHVASLAGVPSPVIDRARELLEKIQSDADKKKLPESGPNFPPLEECKKKTEETPSKSDSWTGALFSDEEMILDEILSVDLNNTTPMQALKAVARWKKTLSGR